MIINRNLETIATLAIEPMGYEYLQHC